MRQSTKLTHKTGATARRGPQAFADLRGGSLGVKAADARLSIPAGSDAVAYGKAGKTPTVICRSFGRGRAVLLNLDVTDYRWKRYHAGERQVPALQAICREALTVAGE